MTGAGDPWGEGASGAESDNPWDDRPLGGQGWAEEPLMEPEDVEWSDVVPPPVAVRQPVRRAPAAAATSPAAPAPASASASSAAGPGERSGEKRRFGWRSWFKGRASSAVQVGDDRLARSVQRPLRAPKAIAFINEGGGTGKTTSALLLGMTIAQLRGRPIVAVDASPGCGDLANRVPASTAPAGTVRTVVAQSGQITSREQVRAHTNMLSGGLEVLAADSSMSADAVFTGAAYEVLAATLRRHYEIVITDCAAGMVSDVVDAVLADADLVVIVSEGGDGVRSSTWTANWLIEHAQENPRYRRLLEDAVVVVNSRHDRTNTNTAKIVDFYRNIVRAVVELPFDQHLEGGNIIDVGRLSEKTRAQLLAFAAAVMAADGINA